MTPISKMARISGKSRQTLYNWQKNHRTRFHIIQVYCHLEAQQSLDFLEAKKKAAVKEEDMTKKKESLDMMLYHIYFVYNELKKQGSKDFKDAVELYPYKTTDENR